MYEASFAADKGETVGGDGGGPAEGIAALRAFYVRVDMLINVIGVKQAAPPATRVRVSINPVGDPRFPGIEVAVIGLTDCLGNPSRGY